MYDTYTQPGGPSGVQSLPLAPRAHTSSFRITRSILMTCDPFYRPFLLPSGGWEKVQDLGAPRTPAPLCLCDHRLVTQLFWALVSSFVNWR